MVIELAPVAPPCFPTRLGWLEYLVAAAQAQKPGMRECMRGGPGEDGPLVFEAGKPVRLNYELNFCADCLEPYRAEQRKRGKCNPDHLRRLSLQELIAAASTELDQKGGQ